MSSHTDLEELNVMIKHIESTLNVMNEVINRMKTR